MARLKPEFDKRRTKVIGLSVDPVANHHRWASDIKETPNYPMIGDSDLKVSKLYGMLPADLDGTCDGRTAADNQTVRNVFAKDLSEGLGRTEAIPAARAAATRIIPSRVQGSWCQVQGSGSRFTRTLNPAPEP